jgi:hypothetical protein
MNNLLKSVYLSTIVILLGAVGCSSTEIKTAKDPQANLAQYKTYAWAPETKTSSAKPNASILDETVMNDTDQQLAAKGLQRTSPASADMLISYSAKTSDKVTYGMAPGYWGWGPEEAYVTPEGTLTLHFVDPKTHKTVWQGSATNAINESGASQKEIGNAISDLFKKYPAV